jgi:hypothetical protein
MRDTYHDSRLVQVIKPQTVTASNANGAVVDLLGYLGAEFVVEVGASGALLGASNLATIRLLESPDNNSWSAIDDGDLIGGNNVTVVDANGEANTVIERGYVGTGRYVTVRIEPTGTISLPVSAGIVRGKPIHAPIA